MAQDARLLISVPVAAPGPSAGASSSGTVQIGRTGLPQNAQVVVYFTPSTLLSDRSAGVELAYSRDAGATYRNVGAVEFAATARGKRTLGLRAVIPGLRQATSDGDIMVRASVSVGSAAAAGVASTWKVYVGAGEDDVYGRGLNTDTVLS